MGATALGGAPRRGPPPATSMPRSTDADATNNYDQIAAIRIRMVLAADRTSPRVNGGVLLTRPKEWYLVPRNLVYERNRIP